MKINFQNLENILGIKIKNYRVFQEALTHRSYLNENKHKNLSSNERLEFLGDAILSFIISEWLFRKLPKASEGALTSFRSNLVKTETLAKIAKKINLGKFLLLSKGEEKAGGRNNSSLLANCLEAIIGAIFIDQDLKVTKNFIYKNFKSFFQEVILQKEVKDFKSLFQELSQEKYKITPKYKLLKESGPDHNKVFTSGVFLGRKKIAEGVGKSKQTSEEEAAKNALEKLNLKG